MTVHRFTRRLMTDPTARRLAPPFLPINSTLQSYLQRYESWCNRPCAAHYRERQARCLAAYGVIIAVSALGGLFGAFSETTKATLLGAALPGFGFLHWSAGDQIFLAAGCIGAGLLAFGAALLGWFATGNVLAPLVVWMLLAWAAGRPELAGLDSKQVASGWQFAVAPTLWMTVGFAWIKPERAAPPIHAGLAADRSSAVPLESPKELSWDDLQRLRLLLDRALQPVERFEGFEWRDQFQTAAVRYQVNFMAYALALTRQRYAPAAEGYFLDAQRQLLAKIGDRRLWRYWQLENAWGRLRFGADPVPQENIMYSGFTALQMAIWRWLILAIGLVLAAEALNTAVEQCCNAVSREFNPAIKAAKDVAAGAVLICASCAALIGFSVFVPYLAIASGPAQPSLHTLICGGNS